MVDDSESDESEGGESETSTESSVDEDTVDLDGAKPLDVMVSFDGTWHKRGFTSLYGVGIVIDVMTGLVLDYEVLSKFCQACSMKDVENMSEREERMERKPQMYNKLFWVIQSNGKGGCHPNVA